MNQVRWLEQILREEKERLADARRTIRRNPKSYSAKVALQSSEIRLDELKNRLECLRKTARTDQPSNR